MEEYLNIIQYLSEIWLLLCFANWQQITHNAMRSHQNTNVLFVYKHYDVYKQEIDHMFSSSLIKLVYNIIMYKI